MAKQNQGKGSRRSLSQWRLLLAKFNCSQMSVEAFCRREAISAASFYRWRVQLGSDGAGGDVSCEEAAPAFVDLGTLDAASATFSSRSRIDLKLELGDGLVLHLVRH